MKELCRLAIVILLPLSFLPTTSSSHAQTQTSNSEVMTDVSHAKMESILRGMGFEFTEKQPDDSDAFFFQLNGYKVTLLNQVKDMQLYAGFSDKVDLTRVNEWNSTYRFSRAYVSDKGGASLEDDLDFAGGVTRTAIEAFIKQFRTTLTSYVKFVTNSPSNATKASSDPVTEGSPTVERTTSLAGATPSSQLRPYTKSPSAKKRIKTPVGDFALWVDETKWKQDKVDTAGVLQFSNVNGEAWARAITERIGIPTNGLREIALINAKKADPNAKITFEDERIVNGPQVLALQIVGTTKGIPL